MAHRTISKMLQCWIRFYFCFVLIIWLCFVYLGIIFNCKLYKMLYPTFYICCHFFINLVCLYIFMFSLSIYMYLYIYMLPYIRWIEFLFCLDKKRESISLFWEIFLSTHRKLYTSEGNYVFIIKHLVKCFYGFV